MSSIIENDHKVAHRNKDLAH